MAPASRAATPGRKIAKLEQIILEQDHKIQQLLALLAQCENTPMPAIGRKRRMPAMY